MYHCSHSRGGGGEEGGRRQEVGGPPVDLALSFFPFHTHEKQTEGRARKTKSARMEMGLEEGTPRKQGHAFSLRWAISPVVYFLFFLWGARKLFPLKGVRQNFPIKSVRQNFPISKVFLSFLILAPFSTGFSPGQSGAREGEAATAFSCVPIIVVPIFILIVFSVSIIWGYWG